MDIARGELWLDGDGESTGDDASGGARREEAPERAFSSSDGAWGSSSLRRDDTSAGSLSSRPGTPTLGAGPPFVAAAKGADVTGDEIDPEDSPC